MSLASMATRRRRRYGPAPSEANEGPDFHGKMRRRPNLHERIRSMTAPAPTHWPHPSPDVRIWDGYIALSPNDQWAEFDTLVDQELERLAAWEAGRMQEDHETPPAVPAEASPAIRELFLNPDRDALDELLGFDEFDAKGQWSAWRRGLANLARQEALALRMRLERGFSYREIAHHLNPKARRFEDCTSLEEVRQLLYRARRKVREAAVGAAEAPGGTPSTENSITSPLSSMPPPDASAPITTRPRTSLKTRSFATSSAASSYAMSSPS